MPRISRKSDYRTTHFFTSLVTVLASCLILVWSVLPGSAAAQIETPKSLVDGISISLFASEPDIVTPTGIAVDPKGRVFCIESHTHFRPENYEGPKSDRIRVFVDSTGDGKADKIKTYFEGTEATMNMAFAPDGSLFVATRSRIFCLKDENRDDQPEVNQTIVELKTEGNYPHNGLSGLAFQDGWLYFGFGENLGVDYDLIGSDGTKISGGGEGGNVFCCRLDGSKLRKTATGFWNPFGLGFDKHGNLFAIDNDPDWRPPCRLLHIVEGGDYGYRFSHGRRGTHPFTSWFGELPGTLGMVSGTGEAPSGIIRCDRVGKTRNTTFLVTSWGLHSIEKFELIEKGASFVSEPVTLIKGKRDFRPVGIAEGPDGSIYVSDWCKRSYELHGHGRIWKVSFENTKQAKPDSPSEQQARLLVTDTYPYSNPEDSIRQHAANRFPANRIDFGKAIQAARSPLEKASLIRRSGEGVPHLLLLAFLGDADPYIRQAARHALSKRKDRDWLATTQIRGNREMKTELANLMRQFSDDPKIAARLPELLQDNEPDVRFVALKWIGEEQLSSFREQLQKEVVSRPLTGRLFESYLAALDMLDKGRAGAEFEKAELKILSDILKSEQTPAETMVLALRKLQSANLRDSLQKKHPVLNRDLLKKLLQHSNSQVVEEAVKTLRDLRADWSQGLLVEIVRERTLGESAVLEAAIGLNPQTPDERQLLIDLIPRGGKLGVVARQGFATEKLTDEERKALRFNGITLNSILRAPEKRLASPAIVSRIQKRLPRADPARGQLIFFNNRFSQCAKCHQVDGRGGQIGPDLSNLTGMSLERLIESILEPSKEIAPRHAPWLIQTYDGRSFTGVLMAERGEIQTYADSKGNLTQVKFDDIERKKQVSQSVMPEGLLDLMSDQEIADLLAYLKQRNK